MQKNQKMIFIPIMIKATKSTGLDVLNLKKEKRTQRQKVPATRKKSPIVNIT